MADYSQSVIYTIKTADGLYVGSTTDFHIRELNHRNIIYNKNDRHYNNKLYQNIRSNNGKYDILIHKKYPCKNDFELRKEEERTRIELNANLNMKPCANLNMTQHQRKNRKEYWKEYRIKNKDKLSEKITCECGSNISRHNLTAHKKTKKHIAVCG